MSAGNTEFIRNAMSKELIFTMGFSVVASFISDFLQPLANITFYVLILSAVLSAIFLILYLSFILKCLNLFSMFKIIFKNFYIIF